MDQNGTKTPEKENRADPDDAKVTEKPEGREGSKVKPDALFFPERFLDTGLRLHGVPVQKFPVPADPLTHLKNIMAVPLRPDDIILAAYPKSGTHWMNDILYMLTRGEVSYPDRMKETQMFEYIEDLPSLESEQSPRIINSHLYMGVMPTDIVKKRVKVIHLIRNPKDVAVSLYNHLKQYAPQEFNFDYFIQGYIVDNYLCWCHQFSYLKQMAEFRSANPDHPVMTIAYEELKKDTQGVIRDIARFLELPVNEELFQEIAAACTFDKLKKVDQSRSLPANVKKTVPGNVSLNLYRKGVVGDWKNQFTVAQSEKFDDFIRQREPACGEFKFTWS